MYNGQSRQIYYLREQDEIYPHTHGEEIYSNLEREPIQTQEWLD